MNKKLRKLTIEGCEFATANHIGDHRSKTTASKDKIVSLMLVITSFFLERHIVIYSKQMASCSQSNSSECRVTTSSVVL
jgi:hypothetical protein